MKRIILAIMSLLKLLHIYVLPQFSYLLCALIGGACSLHRLILLLSWISICCLCLTWQEMLLPIRKVVGEMFTTRPLTKRWAVWVVENVGANCFPMPSAVPCMVPHRVSIVKLMVKLSPLLVVKLLASHVTVRTPLLLSAVILKLGLRRCSVWVIEPDSLLITCLYRLQERYTLEV